MSPRSNLLNAATLPISVAFTSPPFSVMPIAKARFNTRQRVSRVSKLFVAALVAAALQVRPVSAVDVYWDTNGATPGAATSGVANGTWNTSSAATWTTAINGDIATTTYLAASGGDPSSADVFFSAGSDAITSVNVTVNGAVAARSITVQELLNFNAGTGTPSLMIGGGGVILANTMVGTSTWAAAVPVVLSASQSWSNNSAQLFSVAGSLTGAASQPVVLTLAGSGAGGTTLSGILADGAGGSLAVNINTTGGGVTTLSNASSTFTGGLTLTQGILRGVASGASSSALGVGTVTLAGGELQLARSSVSTATNFGNDTIVTGNSQITSSRTTAGVGVTHSLGNLSIGSHTLTIGSSSLVESGTAGIQFATATLTGNAVFNVVNGAASATRLNLGPLSGAGSLTKIGSGNLYLAEAASGFSGDTFVRSGAVVVTNATALGTGTIHLGHSTGTDSAILSVDLGNGSVANNIVVTANPNSNVSTLINPSSAPNHTVTYSGTITLNDDLNVVSTAGGGSIVFSNAIVGPASGVATLTNNGTGTTTFGVTSTIGSNINYVHNAGTTTLSGTNTSFTGTVTVNGGIVSASASGLASGVNEVRVGVSGTLANSQGSNTPLIIAGLGDGIGGGGLVTQNNVNRFITLAGSGTYSFSGTITAGGLNKSGSGTQILSGDQTYTNTTTVTAGTLIIDGSLASATVNVNGGSLGGGGDLAGTVNINSGGTLAPGNMTINTLNMKTGGIYALTGGNIVNVTGQLDLDTDWVLSLGSGFVDGGSVVLFTYSTLAAAPELDPVFDLSGLGFTPTGPLSLSIIDNSIVLNGISAVPEPSVALLAGAGLAVLLFYRRRNS